MTNDWFSIGPFTIHGYGAMIGIGIFAAYCTACVRSRRQNLDADTLSGLMVWCLLGGFGCSKLLYFATIAKEILANPAAIFPLTTGFVVYGGILGGVAAAWLYYRRKKLPFWPYADLVLPSVALAQGFGRIGCSIAGCCYGIKTTLPLAVVYTRSVLAPNNVPLFPVQELCSLLDFLHFAILVLLARRVKGEGKISALYLIFYSCGRFAVEFLRGDAIRGQIGILSTSQGIAILTLALGVFLYWRACKKADSTDLHRKTENA